MEASQVPQVINAALAQWLEQHFCKVKVVGSNPTGGSNCAGLVKRSNTADCKSALYEFAGSNPAPCTKLLSTTT